MLLSEENLGEVQIQRASKRRNSDVGEGTESIDVGTDTVEEFNKYKLPTLYPFNFFPIF